MARRSVKPSAAKPSVAESSADEPSMEQLYHQALDRLILETYGFIIPTETILAWRRADRRKARRSEREVEQLRAQWIETMIREGVGRDGALLAKPGMTRAEVAHAKAHRPREPGKYYPVSRAEVEAARDVALECGVTFSTYTEWYMLRRNYEADPTVLQKGPWQQVQRGPLPSSSMVLMMTQKNPGTTLKTIAAHIDGLGDSRTEQQQAIRARIDWLLADMNRPLRPRRTKLRTTQDGKSD
jgi:hypothetical protein